MEQARRMSYRLGIALAICTLAASSAYSQVVRFETSVGDFDMVLNPTDNSLLQGHVDNLLQYVEAGSYRGSWINRAQDGFVLQMGSFYSHTKRPPRTIASTRSFQPFTPVQGTPGIPGLSNTVGTVAVALPSGPGGINRNGGTSSFFVNVGDNLGLDTDFTVFAAIPDMTVINEIMALTKLDRTEDPNFGAGDDNLAFDNVPIQDNGLQVFIKKAFVVSDAMTIAQATFEAQSVMANSAARFAGGPGFDLGAPPSPSLSASTAVVPEPAALLLTSLAILGGSALLVRRRRGC
jgi:cyclophilin family peptidyl-prolyl cis-trans isomerase